LTSERPNTASSAAIAISQPETIENAPPQYPHAPFQRFVQRALELHAVVLIVEKLFQILAGRKAFPGAGKHQHP
jgi:hypothetical protein